MPREIGERVEVRASKTLAWQPGEVLGYQGFCVVVELDTPITADAWSGVTRRYGGSLLVGGPGNPVLVCEQVEKLTPDELIRSGRG